MISVIIPLYNASQWMCRSIESILRQTFMDWELILVDDGSTDQTCSIAKEYCEKENRIHLIHQTNQGVTAARHTGCVNSSGDSILFLDADDALKENALKNSLDI